MKVKIDRDRDGWFYGTTKRNYEGLDDWDMKSERVATYGAIKALAVKHGHSFENGGWKHKLLSWNWHGHSFDRFPGWEIENPDADRYQQHPAFVKLAHVRGGDDVESSKLCNAWDDVAEVDFYQRDWTDDGVPFVRGGETYWSGWWFATKAERDRFLKWVDGRKTAATRVEIACSSAAV